MFSSFSKLLISTLFIFLVNHHSMALTGKEVSNQIDQWLLKEGVKGKAVFSKTIVFKDCKNELNFSKVFQGYNLIRVTCPDKSILNVAIRVKLQNQDIIPKNAKKLVTKINQKKKNILKIKKKKFFNSIRLNKTLEKNSVLQLEDLSLISSNSSNKASFFNNKNDLIGRKLKQNLKMDQLLHPRHLYEKFEIQSGDSLSIVSSIGNASVTVSGEAQDSGNLGDLIKVKNLRSGKIVKGYIKKNKIIKVFR